MVWGGDRAGMVVWAVHSCPETHRVMLTHCKHIRIKPNKPAFFCFPIRPFSVLELHYYSIVSIVSCLSVLILHLFLCRCFRPPVKSDTSKPLPRRCLRLTGQPSGEQTQRTEWEPCGRMSGRAEKPKTILCQTVAFKGRDVPYSHAG